MPKIAFIIERSVYYRLLAPLIDEALAQGWDVECWHDYGQPRTGVKQYQFPEIESAPTFVNGIPIFRIYNGSDQLRKRAIQNTVAAIVSLGTPLLHFGAPLPTPSPKWIGIQHNSDFFITNGPAGIASVDLSFVYSNHWRTWTLEYFREAGLTTRDDHSETEILTKMSCAGFPQLDPSQLIDSREVRDRWGIPEEQPVVVLLPYSTHGTSNSFWSKYIYGQTSRIEQLSRVAFARRFKYLSHIWYGWNDSAVVNSVKAFCERNGAYLIVKSRLKDPISSYLQAVADRCVYDETLYPHTIMEVFSIANLCVGFYSWAVLEAAHAGASNLCITPSLEDWREVDHFDENLFKVMLNNVEGGPFQFKGVSTAMGIPEVISTLPGQTLVDFELDP